MEDHKLIDKLKNETNISYEEAKIAIEKSNWDILDAFVYLEENGKVHLIFSYLTISNFSYLHKG